MLPEHVIKRPLILTEKGNALRETQNKYLFEVARGANKIEIKNAVETLFNVAVVDVQTMIVRGRMRRMGRGHAKTQNWKKAIVQVREGETIDLGEGT
ncbi:50S ribosomal protein L23 [Sandaracinus amylolyticus]|uniref:Large ribosomal subunit protein uL23 n=1 Tax=Sandaracinus amylolyticus TaxID=927083 RepID=A0A0F6YLR2_9BACT|nr:50S ribosomal protein L23 [Sandaracinus amylolyticus]AKF10641.1 LSU ribosomal protein L23p (L23Ae) [Sandaracinus amylolyticus]